MLSSTLGLSGELCVSSFKFSSHGSIQVPGIICHRSFQSSYSCGTLLDGGSLASHSSQHVGKHSSLVSHCKGPHHGCLSQLGAKGSAIAAFNPLAAKRCLLCRQGFSSSVCHAVMGGLKNICDKNVPVMMERADWIVSSRVCTKQFQFCP